MSGSKKLAPADRAKREDKRLRRAARRAEVEAHPPPAAAPPTLHEVIRRGNLVWSTSKATRALIRDTDAHVRDTARRSLVVVSCDTCTAPKGCCSLTVVAFFHEAIPIVDRLRREGRDTAELRAALSTSAQEMESRSPDVYRRPCAFLDAAERCTVYDQRPSECGMAFVSSPPSQCSDPAATSVEKLPPAEPYRAMDTERTFEREARLIPLKGPYMGTLPRMVLLCLEAWDRPDYAQYLAAQIPLVAQRTIDAIHQ
jgi:Fe-S-cluster containining protein